MRTACASFPEVLSIHENHLQQIAQQKKGDYNYNHPRFLRKRKLSHPPRKHSDRISAFSVPQSKAHQNYEKCAEMLK